MTKTKPRDVQAIYIAAETFALRSRSWNRLRFEIEYALEKGTTANSFLIQGALSALIDPPGGTFTEIYLNELRKRINILDISYVILGHVNQNRIETLKELLEINSRITFICTNAGAIALRQSLESDRELKIQVVRGEETLDLGKDHILKFIPTSTPRYPDELCTYDSKTKILYTDKFFGAHICGDQVFDEGWSQLLGDRRYYFDSTMANQVRQVEAALDKIGDFPAAFYAPGHGPMLRYGLHELVNLYRQWCENQKQQSISVALLFASAYGNTTTIANALARGITKAGVAVELINCENAEPEEIKNAIEKSSGFLIGSPTLAGHLPTQVQTALGIVLSTATKSYQAGVFGSYGWSGEAVDIISGKLKDAGYTLAFEPIRIKFTPTEATLQICEETGTDFAQMLKSAKKVRTTLNPGSTVEQAVGRIVGSLCVLTVKRGEVSTAMLASWVSQATFNPPGLTIAVAKDRAIESYLYEGDRFVINILEQGKQLRKHFMKKFAPGEDRFINIQVEPTEGGLILNDGLAYLECRVSQRMECGDHWIVYAIVENGKLLQSNGLTAIHHRKTASNY
ncbi:MULTISPECIES: diflavin flavoprotein [Pseudanabaena]|uniref:Flavin reductase domain protein FMN-binding n=2 Tax=Pseudanabaena TaxID=1152 RepID=L8MWM2_9CYAN|nr:MULTISPECIES: diflavin flavoprotein [Pseudanabaena]ELS30850.1 flavin reductase domain protein FMN-binding [Pseudanabaena biceps PCC 7429]MDG3496889.1 diflavin flavoprotein [Pseudanabaena catenata USMAC16]